MLKAVKKRRASEDVVDQIVNLIMKGKLKKGDQLPTERELTETFKVSRTTVREAIRSLESRKLVEIKQGNGTYVLASGEQAGIAPLAASLFNEKDDLMDIFYLRKIIEPFIAQLAAGNATSAEIEELEGILRKQQEGIESGQNFVPDIQFHLALARIARNRVLGRLLRALMDLMDGIRENSLANPVRAEKSLKGHRAIFEAVRREDCEAARSLMLDHLSEIEAVLFKGKKLTGKCR